MQEIEEIRFLCSPLVLKEVLAALARNTTRDLEKHLLEALERERFHQSPLSLSRLEGLWKISQPKGKKNRQPVFFNLLFYLARKYFRWSPKLGLPVLREEMILSFQHLPSHLLVDQLWLFALACKPEDPSHLRPRRRIPSRWEEFFLPPVDDPLLLELRRQGMAEVHRHLSGSLPPLFLWENFLRRWRTFIRDCFAPKNCRRWLPLLPPEIEIKELCLWIYLIPALRGALYQKETEYFEKIRRALFYQDFHSIFSLNEKLPYFLRKRCEFPGLKERSFLLETYKKILSSENLPPNYEWWFYAYLLLQNNWLKLVVLPEKGEGFERFEKLAHAPPRDFLEENSFESLQRFLELEGRNGVRSVELRFKPDEEFPKFRKKLHLVSQIRKRAGAGQLPLVGVVLHFIKEEDKALDKLSRNEPLPVRHSGLRKKLRRLAIHILRFKSSEKGTLIVGLDAANNELYTSPEVFSPVIRFLRAKIFERQFPLDSSEPSPLGLTFHAGESFRHLLSGLRYIDEALEFLEMQPGDRLGHALALGLDPEKWIRKNRGAIFMPREEWLDDLVWFFYSLRIVGNFPELTLRYHEEIFRHLHYIYDQEVDLESYFRVWRYLRREEALFLNNDLHYFSASFKPARWLFETRRNLPRTDFDLWKKYHLDRKVRRRAMEFIEVEADSFLVEPLRAVQKKLLQKCIQRQIIIEINPSSNLVIGGLEDLSEHPVFRWAPPQANQRSCPWIVVGSDDPGIFQTQLWHEYIFLAYAAREKGATPYEISSWLEELARNSRRFTFLVHCLRFSGQL